MYKNPNQLSRILLIAILLLAGAFGYIYLFDIPIEEGSTVSKLLFFFSMLLLMFSFAHFMTLLSKYRRKEIAWKELDIYSKLFAIISLALFLLVLCIIIIGKVM